MLYSVASLLSMLLAGGLVWFTQAVPAPPPTQPLELTLNASTRLLVLAPHPDDEALGAAGLIAKTMANGGTVRVVLLTSGDAFPEAVRADGRVANPTPADYRDFGVRRERETIEAMRILGVPVTGVSFLGFPDEGLCRLASTYLYDKRRAFASPYTDRARPPASEQIIRGARYRGVDVRLELERIAREFRPTLIALPHPEDDHPDHCSTHIFAREAFRVVRTANVRLRVLHYLVHFGQWPLEPDAGGPPGTTPPVIPNPAPLAPPAGFPLTEGHWRSLVLSADEVERKQRAMERYTSQLHVIGRFLQAFVRPNELYIEDEPGSLPECWCDGENVATERSPSQYRRRP